MDSHPIHFHGHRWWVVETDGGQLPKTAWWPETTMNVPPGTTRTVEFVADNPGDWAFHCHKNHHAMNAMSHEIPNVIGVDQKGVAQKISKLVPGYMAMGESGMGNMVRDGRDDAGSKEHASDDDRVPANSGQSTWAACSPSSKYVMGSPTMTIRVGIKTRPERLRRRSPVRTHLKNMLITTTREQLCAGRRHDD